MGWQPGLTLYALGHRGAASAAPPVADSLARPDGRLVWLHAPLAEGLRPMLALARRLLAAEGPAVLLTTGEAATDRTPGPAGLLRARPPADDTGAIRAFLDRWRPDTCVLAGGQVSPLAVHAAAQRRIPQVMVEARSPGFPPGRTGWYPGLMAQSLGSFARIVAVDEPAARSFRRAGAPSARVAALGRMEQPSAALPCLEAERAALARLLGTRPVWFAALPPEAEEPLVIAAHRAALRLAHRMLMIVAPDDPARAAPLAGRLAEVEGWTVARRALDEEPDDDTQVFIVDASELGLWLRLAPVTYLGGSLTPGGARLDPAYPAALGSAIVHGPRAGAFGATVGRLAAAQAGVLVGSGADLCEALGGLAAPDRAARAAAAAWAVTSEGAEVTEAVLDTILSLLPAAP